MKNTKFNTAFVLQYLPIILLVFVCGIIGILYPNFFSIKNLLNLLRQMSFLMIVSMGMTFVILMGSIDASVGAAATLSGVVAALSAPALGGFAVVVGVTAGALIGVVNGTIVVKAKVPSFLATLAMMGALDGAALILMNGSPVNIANLGFLNVANSKLVFGLPNIEVIPIIAIIVAHFIITKTPFGRSLYAIGGNETATFYSGIKVRKIQIAAFTICGALSGLAGCLQASMFEAAVPYMGDSLQMNSIAAVIIGGTQLSGGVGGPLKTVFGVVLIAVISSSMNFMGLEPATRQIVTGVIMILAVTLNIDRTKMAYVK
jgi:ribose/xylose/arabinose/galactoside ABC-type transport system permease subunit